MLTKGLRVKMIIKLNCKACSGLGALPCSLFLSVLTCAYYIMICNELMPLSVTASEDGSKRIDLFGKDYVELSKVDAEHLASLLLNHSIEYQSSCSLEKHFCAD